ncbi:unnamed protein product [Lactuca virosa]|uniref:Uncharacterized protein n=1 Tax=Lactuca virosa TaxID=75947 RepID=A0AAU9MVR2_9ASTR|nr:unnamed protein product [Lactuca virosa]
MLVSSDCPPFRLPGFGPDTFGISQLLGAPCPTFVVPTHTDSTSHVDVGSLSAHSLSRKRKRPLTPHQFEHFLREVSGGSRCVSPPPFDHTSPIIADGCASCIQFQEELNEACRSIALAESIISTVLGQESKFLDGLLTLQDRYLFLEVNLQATEGMKLAGEEMLFKVVEVHADLYSQYRVAADKVVVLENQRSLLESDYEVCLRENDVLRA